MAYVLCKLNRSSRPKLNGQETLASLGLLGGCIPISIREKEAAAAMIWWYNFLIEFYFRCIHTLKMGDEQFWKQTSGSTTENSSSLCSISPVLSLPSLSFSQINRSQQFRGYVVNFVLFVFYFTLGFRAKPTLLSVRVVILLIVIC